MRNRASGSGLGSGSGLSGAQRASSAALGIALVSAATLALPAAASAEPVGASPIRANDEVAAVCAPANAELRWGVKESFRSYISGSIAQGEWTVSDDMRYETPSFIWDSVTGSFTNDLSSGQLEFTGAVHFTGHAGALELDIANPALEFAGDDTAYLLLTVGSTDQADAGGEATPELVRAAKIDLAGVVDAGGTELSIAEAPVRLTAEGAAALNGEYGSYIAGEEVDPISLQATVSGCELGESAPEPADPATEEGEAGDDQPLIAVGPAEETRIPWVPIIIGGVALLVIGVTGGMLLAGRKRSATSEPAAGGTENGAPDGEN